MKLQRLSAIGKGIRQLLFGARSREFLVFLFFLAVSAGFWLLQTLDENFETDILVPVQLTDVPEGVVITTPLPESLRVTIRDKGATLVRYWRQQVPPVHFSFADYPTSRASGQVTIPPSDVTHAIQASLLSTTRIQALHPDTLEFFYNHGHFRNVPVTIAGHVDTDAHHYLFSLVAEPSTVRVYASPAILDTLSAVETRPLNVNGLQENTTLSVPLQPIRGAKFEPNEVSLQATVDVYMENTVEIPIVSLNFPGDCLLRTFPSTVRVTYTIGYARNKEVVRDNFVSVVTYEQILALQRQGEKRIPIQLKTIPEGVTNVRIEPEEVDYLIETVSEEEE